MNARAAARAKCAKGATLRACEADATTEGSDARPVSSVHSVVASASQARNVAPLAQFALDAARAFTTFYHECPVLAAETEAQRTARAQVCAATRLALRNTLHLLGIETPERM